MYLVDGRPFGRERKPLFRRCCGPLSALEATLIFATAVLLSALLLSAVVWLLYPLGGASWRGWGADEPAVCTTRGCARIAALFAANMREEADPCADFYEFACGNYALDHELSVEKSARHTISDVTDRLLQQIRSVVSRPVRAADSPYDRMAKRYYAKCMDEQAMDTEGAAPLLGLLERVGGWPVVVGRGWKSERTWQQLLALLATEMGVNSVVVDLTVVFDQHNSSINVIEIDQANFGMGSRYYYLRGVNATVPMRENYTTLISSVAQQLGADSETAASDAADMLQLETDLAEAAATESMRRDNARVYNPMKFAELDRRFPMLNLSHYIRLVFGEMQLNDDELVIVRELDYFSRLQGTLARTKARTVANYALWRTIMGFAPFLHGNLRKPFYRFQANQTGLFNVAQPSRWRDCVRLSNMILDMPVGAMYVKHFFAGASALAKMDQLAAYLKEAFVALLHAADWMDDVTKAVAVDKAHALQYKSGYPEWLFNDTAMEQCCGRPDVAENESLLLTTIALKLLKRADELASLKVVPADKTRWFQGPAVVDAYYAPNLNQMIFPAGIMQFPFLTADVPNYVVFAMAGAVVGHEVSHAFDDQGGRYDKHGNLHDWWDAQTKRHFENKSSCFVQQYGSIRPTDSELRLDGDLSLGENIADNSGLRSAYAAYRLWLDEYGADEAALPGLQNYTSDQLFFLAYSNNWCSLMRREWYARTALTDVHAPPPFRATIPLRNQAHFAAAFRCPLGSPMNPQHKCTLW